jgi:hypothetical protein
MSRAPGERKSAQEFWIFAHRSMHFINLWTVYSDLLSGHYVPSVNLSTEENWTTDVKATAMFILYSYFYSLIEDDEQSLNAFRIWRLHYPEEETAIAAMEKRVAPFRGQLKLFRNRLGFHGSRTQKHEAKALELFSQHSGTEIWLTMRDFKALNSAFFEKSNMKQGISKLTVDQLRARIDSIAAQ